MPSGIHSISHSGGAHASDDELVLWLDGELPARKMDAIRTHLAACWSCRVRMEKLQQAISSFIGHRNASLGAAPVLASHVRSRFEAELARRAAAGRRVWARTRRSWGYLRVAGIAASVLLAVAWWTFSPVRVVSAAALLDHSCEAQRQATRTSAAPVVRQRLYVRRRVEGQSDRAVNVRSWTFGAQRRVTFDGDAGLWPELERMLQLNRWQESWPVSAAAFRAWRDSIQVQHESVTATVLEGGDSGWRLRTVADGPLSPNAIVEATLDVRAATWQPVRESFRVAMDGGFWIYELQQNSFEVIALNSLPRDFFAEVLPPRGDVAAVASGKALPQTGPTPADLDRAEVEAEWVLHRLGLCVSNTVEIVREATGLRLRGSVETLAERDELQDALKPIPYLNSDIQTVEEEKRAGERGELKAGADESAPSLVIRDAPSRLEEQLASGPSLARQSGEIVLLSEGLKAQAWALRRIAERYKDHRSATFGASQRRVLGAIIRDHSNEIHARSGELETRVASLLPAAPLREPEDEAAQSAKALADSGDWNNICFNLFAEAAAVDEAIHVLLAGTGASVREPSATLSETLEVLSRLRARSRNLERLSAVAFATDSTRPRTTTVLK